MKRTATKIKKLFKIYLPVGLTSLFLLQTINTIAQDYDFEQSDDNDNLVVMEAENFSENTPNGTASWSLTDSPEDYSGEGIMMAVCSSPFATAESALTGSAVLTYKIKFIQSGTHYIWARASRTGGSDDSFHAGIDGTIGETSTFINFEGDVSAEKDTLIWIYWCNPAASAASVEVPSSGVHNFNIYIRENGFKVDKFILTTNQQYVPDSLGPNETIADTTTTAIYQKPVAQNLFVAFSQDDELHLKVNNEIGQNAVFEVITIQGQVVKTIYLNNRKIMNVNISELIDGMYLIRLKQNNKMLDLKKFIKH